MLVLGGAGVAVGLVGLFALSDDDGESSGDGDEEPNEVGAVRLLVGPSSLGLRGRF
jgi:hypothetical protein